MIELQSYKLKVDFKDVCKSCHANCCRRFYAILLPEEEELFRNASFELKTEKGSVKCIGSKDNKPCPFLKENGYCGIYEKRPFDCRLWPIVVYIDRETREKIVYLDLDCPAVLNQTISPSMINKILRDIQNIKLDDEWLEKYTLAPWPNNFIELFRYR